jgi:CheY-like chemotaxis protein
MTTPNDTTGIDDGPYAALKAFLLGQGIARHKQTGEIAGLLGLAKTSVFRKFKGESSFTLPELKAIAEHFGTDTPTLRGLSSPHTPSLREGPRLETAYLHLPGLPSTGELRLGPILRDDDICDLVAVAQNQTWHVFARGAAELQDQIGYSIAALSIRALPRQRIAILEDDHGAAALLLAGLEEAGMVVHSYDTASTFITAISQLSYQAYVIDWILGGSTAQTAIEAIRQKQSAAPIAITTGALHTGMETEGQLIPFAERSNAGIFEKPFRHAVLASYLRRSILTNEADSPS